MIIHTAVFSILIRILRVVSTPPAKILPVDMTMMTTVGDDQQSDKNDHNRPEHIMEGNTGIG
jgi:hypothetical protein